MLHQVDLARALGLSGDFLARAQLQPPSRNDTSSRATIHRRMFAAMALNELLNEAPLAQVSEDFGLSRGQLQQLQSSAAAHGAMVCLFCETMEWWALALVIGQVQERVGHGVATELTGLVCVPSMTATRARILFDGGISTAAQLASTDVTKIAQILQKSCRGGTRKLDPVAAGGKDEVHAVLRRMEFRTAKLLVRNARRYAQQTPATAQAVTEAAGPQQPANFVPFNIVDVSRSDEDFLNFSSRWNEAEVFAWQPVQESGQMRGLMISLDAETAFFVPLLARTQADDRMMQLAQGRFTSPKASKICFDLKSAIPAVSGLFTISAPLEDPMLASGLLHASGEARDVKSLYEAYCGEEESSKWPPEKVLGCGRLSVAALVIRSFSIHKHVMACLEQHQMTILYREVEMPLVPVLSAMEVAGIGFSESQSQKLAEQIGDTLQGLQSEINLMAGRTVRVSCQKDVCEAISDCIGQQQPLWHRL